MVDLHRQIHEHIRMNPGVHFNELTRNLDIATGQTQYHLHQLNRSDKVVAERICGRTHYFSPEYDAWERRMLSLYRRETTRNHVTLLLNEGQLSATTIADHLDLARSTISWHIDTLADAGVVERSYGDRGQVEVALAHPEKTEQFLRTVTPLLSDRLIDRCICLVDDNPGRSDALAEN